MNKTWGKVLEGRGYQTALGNDGAFYTGSDEVGWYYNPDPSVEAQRNAESEYFRKNKNENLTNAMLKHSTDSVNLELSRITPGTEQSINAFGLLYKVRAGDKPNTVYRTYGFGTSLNLTDAFKRTGIIKESLGDTYWVNNSQRKGIGFHNMAFETTNVPVDNSDIDINNSHFRLGHTVLTSKNRKDGVSLKKVDDYNFNVWGSEPLSNNPLNNNSNSPKGMSVGIEAEYTQSYEVKSSLSDEEEALVRTTVPNMDIDNMRAEAASIKYSGQGKKYINKNNQKKYFVKGDKSEQPQILTNTGRFVNIKKSVLKDDYYEEDPDDK